MQNRTSVQKFTATGLMLATALSGSIAPLALAQDPATTTGEAVVITGSNIKRSDYEGPQSVLVYDSKKIEQSGARTVTEVLKRLPQNTAGFTDTVNTGLSFSPGASAASLRGLGVTATLVLLNGRRIAPFPLAQNGTDAFVDLNSIPIEAIDRIEILKEGASAVYGSDAIAGVINIILKENYSGGQVETYYGNTTNKDAAEVRSSILSGFANEKFHLMLNANYYHRNPLASVDRDYSRSADHRDRSGIDLRSSRGNPGTIFFSGSPAFPDGAVAVPRGGNGLTNAPGFNPDTYFLPGVLPDGSLRNRFNFNEFTELISETERWGALTTFGYSITPHIEFFGEVGYQSVKSVSRIAPTPPDSAGDGLIVPATNPFNPFGEDVAFLWRSTETGPRRDRVELDTYRYLGGLKFKDLPKNWSAEVAFLYTEANLVDHSYGGFLSVAKTQAALNDTNPATALNVFGDGAGINNPNTLKGLISRPRNDGISYIYSTDFKATGDLFELPAGAVKLAIGGEYREEAASQNDSVGPGVVVATGGAGYDGNRDVRSLFYEVAIPVTSSKWNVPMLRALEFSIAQRYDDYSDFGDTTKPKFGFKLKPIDGVLFRGAYSEGFRAPSIPQLFTGSVRSFDTVVDPVTGQAGDVPITTGGNPALKPETSYGYFLGAVVDPPFIPGLSIGVDFYRIEQRNLIDQPSAQFIVDNIPSAITRGPGGAIANIDSPFRNLGTVVVDGFDVDVNYKLETSFGTFRFESLLAFINSFEQVILPGDPNQEFVDTFAIPEFKMVNSLYYTKGGFEAGVTVNYIDSYDDENGTDKSPTRKIGSFTTVDLQASYEFSFSAGELPNYSKDKSGGKSSKEMVPGTLTGWKKWLNGTKITVGCLNVGDVDPPFANIEEGYDTTTADATGRFIYASLRKKFW
ncbi:MAG: TonB-dependent receptor [Chthoniobacteraceae bacterium]